MRYSKFVIHIFDLSHTSFLNGDALLLIGQTERTPIAVSKKCCWCCWELYQYWHRGGTEPNNQARGVQLSSTTPPDLVLLGSHSIIFPWYPPPVGVDIDFLQMLEAKLQTILIEVLEKGTKSVGGKSEQSSARSSFEGPEGPDRHDRFKAREKLITLGVGLP